MEENIIELQRRVKELENEVSVIKVETTQALKYMSDKFSQELNQLMSDYREELKKEVVKIINSID